MWSTTADAEFEETSPRQRIMAEGNSRFDYPVGLDILDHLKSDYGYDIFKVAEAGAHALLGRPRAALSFTPPHGYQGLGTRLSGGSRETTAD